MGREKEKDLCREINLGDIITGISKLEVVGKGNTKLGGKRNGEVKSGIKLGEDGK